MFGNTPSLSGHNENAALGEEAMDAAEELGSGGLQSSEKIADDEKKNTNNNKNRSSKTTFDRFKG